MKILLFLLPVALAFGQAVPEVTTDVQLENFVFYMDQNGDGTRISSMPGPVPFDPQLGGTLRRYAIIADVVSIGGKPAIGTFIAHGVALGGAIFDIPRNQMHNMTIEILTPDRVQVGALYGFWMGAGASAPGAPTGSGVLAVLGGTGAYYGVRGQGTNAAASGLRIASMMEDASRRRVNGGGRMNLRINLSGASLPEVISVFHADFAPVTVSNPARSGEVLIVQVKAGWPVRPPLGGGQVFAGAGSLQEVAVPVGAVVNEAPAEIVNALGWPGTKDQYRVDFRVPSGLTPGMAKLQLSGGYLPGLEFSLPVQ